MKLHEICERIYSKHGQGAVMDYIVTNHPMVPWSYCEPCETDSPMDDGACLVCGSA